MNNKYHLLIVLTLTILSTFLVFSVNEYMYRENELEQLVPFFQQTLLQSTAFSPTIYLRINTTQIFTELYEHYGFLDVPKRTVFDQALYLNLTGVPKPFPLQPDVQAIFDRADCMLSTFHTRSGNLDLYKDPLGTKNFFYIANGSFYLMNAIVYALVKTFRKQQFVFTEQIPYYAGHHTVVSLLFNWA